MAMRNKSVDVHQFAMVPRADIPRSRFRMQKALKTTFNGSLLIPIFCEEILPGDSWKLRCTVLGRLATPLFPIMDNLFLDVFFFFVPNRLVWDNWQRFMGEQDSPEDSIDFLIPQVESAAGGFPVRSVFDYFGLPTVGQVAVAETISVNALPLRGWNLIWNEWFRDQNLNIPATVNRDDGPDPVGDYDMLTRAKKHDYFTSCLPWPQKGDSVMLPLGDSAPVYGAPGGLNQVAVMDGANQVRFLAGQNSNTAVVTSVAGGPASAGPFGWPVAGQNPPGGTGLVADLASATAATINQIRQAFQIQRLLERDARGGTRYTEIIRSHFGVLSPDARLQRPEYLGGGSVRVAINPVAQTSATTVDGSDTPQGNLSAIGTVVANGYGFTQSFTEHGYVFGLVSSRVDLTYQQGCRKMWLRQTRYDFYFPAFAYLGEQAVLSREIYSTGEGGDSNVFGYQERWAEYRYLQSEITGLFRSTSAGTIDPWHLAERFNSRPGLNEIFLIDPSNTSLQRALAVGEEANGQQFIADCFFDVIAARPMPLYSVPGNIDRF